MELEEAAESYQNDRAKDDQLTDDFDYASDVVKARGEPAVRFNPGTEVSFQTQFGYRVEEPYALLTEDEYRNVTGVEVQDAGAEPCNIDLHGPASGETFYLLGLEGLAPDVAASLRKIYLDMSVHSHRSDLYLRPEDQLLPRQGWRMMGHVHGLFLNSKHPQQIKAAAEKPKSAADLQRLAQLKAEERAVEEAAIAQRAKLLEQGLAGDDSADEMLKSEARPEESSKRTKRMAGFSGGVLEQATAPTAPAKLSKPSKKASAPGPGSFGGAAAEPAQRALPAQQQPPSTSSALAALPAPSGFPGSVSLPNSAPPPSESAHGSTASNQDTEPDPEMETVGANATGNVKCLKSLRLKNFLALEEDRQRCGY